MMKIINRQYVIHPTICNDHTKGGSGGGVLLAFTAPRGTNRKKKKKEKKETNKQRKKQIKYDQRKRLNLSMICSKIPLIDDEKVNCFAQMF